MPELPEVETVRKVLAKELVGLTVTKISVLYKNIILGDVEEFIKGITNKTFTNVLRTGKLLMFELGDIYFTSHLRMEGKYFLKDSFDLIEKHEHVIFYLSNGKSLRYHDVRKFGQMSLKNKNNLFSSSPVTEIGYEPFNENLKPEYLKDKYNKKLPIKSLLLDQSIMAGLGNIYVDEVLFKCNIHPETLGKDIDLNDCQNIIKHSKEILTKSIEQGGTTIRTYTSSLNVIGNYQNYLNVHTKVGQKCPICSNVIEKIRVGGRGTYFCPNCQKQILTK